MRRHAALMAVVALVLLAGCGGGDESSTPLDDALGYLARDAPFVAAVETDPDGPQVRRLVSLVSRFPAAGSLGQQLEDLSRLRFVDYERDVRPLLGHPVVVGLLRPAAGSGLTVPLVLALHVDAPSKAKQLLLRQPGFLPRGKASGARVWEDTHNRRYAAVDGDVLVLATNRDILEQALALKRGDNRMREAGFDDDLRGLPGGALVRISADPRAFVGVDPRLRPALEVKWLAAVRRLGATLRAQDDGLALDFRVRTDAGSIGDDDLPLAPEPGSLPLIGSAGDVRLGLREPARLARFAAAVWRAVAPRSAARVERALPAGADLDRDLAARLGDSAALAVDPQTRAFAARIRLGDPAGVRNTLAALAPAFPALAAALGVPGAGVATPAEGESFYALARPDGRTLVFGVVGGSLVAASEPRRASDLASEPGSEVPGPPAAAVVTIDARRVAGDLLAANLEGPAALFAPLAVAALRDLTASATITRDGLRGHAKLTIVK